MDIPTTDKAASCGVKQRRQGDILEVQLRTRAGSGFANGSSRCVFAMRRRTEPLNTVIRTLTADDPQPRMVESKRKCLMAARESVRAGRLFWTDLGS